MTNEEVQSSIYTNGCHAEAVIPDASRYSPLATDVAVDKANESVCNNVTSETVETSTSKAGCCGVPLRRRYGRKDRTI